MNYKHTPGPWEGEGWLIISRTAQTTICELSKLYATQFVSHVPMGYTREHQDEVRANARLIKAAPEMLEALELAQYAIEAAWLAGVAGSSDLSRVLMGVDKEKFVEARAAIRGILAKVEGVPEKGQ